MYIVSHLLDPLKPCLPDGPQSVLLMPIVSGVMLTGTTSVPYWLWPICHQRVGLKSFTWRIQIDGVASTRNGPASRGLTGIGSLVPWCRIIGWQPPGTSSGQCSVVVPPSKIVSMVAPSMFFPYGTTDSRYRG